MQLVTRYLIVILTLIASSKSQAEDLLGYDRFTIYADTANLTFAKLSELEKTGNASFTAYNKLLTSVKVYWIKISAHDLGNSNYVILSNYFDRIETYYSGDTSYFSLTGRLIDFEDRSYKAGFYRNVLPLKVNSGDLYVKLISEDGYSLINRTLSHLELASFDELKVQSKQLFTSSTILFGMEIIILIINLILVIGRPNAPGSVYIWVIASGVMMTMIHNQVFIDSMGFSTSTIAVLEIVINMIVLYVFFLFSALYLNARTHSPLLFRVMVFPFVIPLLILAFTFNGFYFPATAMTTFMILVIALITLLFKTYRKDYKKTRTYIFANALVIGATIASVIAHNGFLDHRFLTTNLIFIGFMMRDTVLTVDLGRHYFQLIKESIYSKATLEKLNQEMDQLKRIDILKAKFFNNVSHELRTPLTLILSPLESSLNSGKVPEELKQELNLSLKNGKYLLQLVNEMLDLAKLDKGELDMFRQPTDIVQVIKDIRETFQPYAKEKNQTIFITNAHDSVIAKVDQDKFEKIIINLISNAIKYSNKPGNIFIEVREKGNELEVLVIDESRGIVKKELPRIFDRYFQSEEISSDDGTGIGLSIVKEFMEMHKGTVACTSKPGQGSKFTLSFPKAIQTSEKITDLEEKTNTPNPSKSTLLLVEDHSEMRQYLKNKFDEYNIVEASDGKKGYQKLKDGLMPDLILTDYVMPEMNGYELAQKIKKETQWMNLPIIFLTARTLNEDKMKVLNLGVDDYIIKPFDLEELKVRIKNMLEVSEQRKDFVKKNIPDLSIEKQKSFKSELDNYILENLSDAKLSNTDLSYHFTVSERNLYRRVKLVTGQPPASYIREIRLQKARLLLETQSEMTISEVAYECGIDNLSHFSQTFKKRFGKLPSDTDNNLINKTE